MTPRDVRDAAWKNWLKWAGRVVSLAPIGILASSATWKLTRDPWYVAEWERIGYADSVLMVIGLIQVTCLILYVLPPTAVLGTVLLTGYLGGATATYIRIGEFYPAMVPLTTSLLAWAGLYLRDERLRALLPVRRTQL